LLINNLADAPMTDSDEKPTINISAQRARQGITLGVMRYVLGVSLVLAIVAMGAVWFLN